MVSQLTRELEIDIKRDVLSGSYYEFVVWSFHRLFPNERFEPNFHIRYLCDLYQAEIERIIRKEEKDKDIIVNIPPRSSKSLITNVCLNAWAWIRDPTIPFISVSFDEDLSLLNSQYTKDIINDDEYKLLFGHIFSIRRDANSKGYFMNDKGGFRLSKTTGSNITGHKGTVIIVDDPQNPKTAESEVKRKEVISYYTNSLYNRLTPINLGVRIIIMQRLHQGDLTGYLLENNKEDYTHVCLPAQESELINPPQLKQFYQEKLLDPMRLSASILRSFLKTLGTRGFAGQYQQTPSPEGGGIWKKDWFDIVSPLFLKRDVANSPINIYIDGAYTEKTENDPTGILTTFTMNNNIYIVDFQELWLEFPQLIAWLTEYCQLMQINKFSRIVIEPKASGKSIVQQLRANTQYNVIESAAPQDDKITRAHGVSPVLEGRRVKLVEGRYIENFLNYIVLFPNADHDEAIDLTVMAINDQIHTGAPDVMWV